MKKTNVLFSALAIILLLTLNQCKKENKNLPKACFTADYDRVSSGTTVKFSNCTVNGTTYQWSFGDGQSSTDKEPEHAYATTGTYTVTLIAINADGQATATKVINVISCDPGYEGANCTVESRAKFIGTYAASEVGTYSGVDNFTVTVANNATNISNISIRNFYKVFTNPVIATVNGNSFTIASQSPDGNATVSGSGFLYSRNISISYVVVSSNQTQTDNVTATWVRQ